MEYNPHLKFVNGRDHGYLILTLSSDEARGDWYYVDNIKDENSGERLAKTIKITKDNPVIVKLQNSIFTK